MSNEFSSWMLSWEVLWPLPLRGRQSRSKASVGESAHGPGRVLSVCGIF